MNAVGLRRTFARFATGVAVATTRSGNGCPVGVTINSFTSVSLDPPLVLWCLSRTSLSLSPFTSSVRHAVNILSGDQERLAAVFSGSDDRFRGVPVRENADGLPILEGSAAWLICRRREVMDGGDHVIILSEVVEHHADLQPALRFQDGHYYSAP